MNNGRSSLPSYSREDSSTINYQFAPYKRFDLSFNQEQLETSFQTQNGSINLSANHSIFETSQAHIQTFSKNSKSFLRGMSVVFSPIALAMLAISVFIRIGFVLAHAGVLQALIQLGLCLIILFCTLLSVCSFATNGTIDGGGVYHMISRSLGPEFGGGVGILFYVATVIGNGQSVAAIVEFLVELFGPGREIDIFQNTHWWRFLYGTVINLFSLILCLLSAPFFPIIAFFILILVGCVYGMMILSFIVQHPLSVLIPKTNTYAYNHERYVFNRSDFLYGQYTGFNLTTFRENLYSNYSIDYTTGDMMSFSTVFGILFSSVTGFLSGATMCGQFKEPSRSFSKGSISATVFAFLIYISELFLIATTTDRYTLLNNYLFLPDINLWKPCVIIGMISAAFSSCLSGLIGSSRAIQALSKDEIFGVLLRWIGKGTTHRGNPIAAALCSFVLVEFILLIGSLNKISRLATIFFLLSYFAVNLSCLALDLASTPNFRPIFKYFSWHTALIGALGSIVMCFYISALFASIGIGILTVLIAVLHLRDFPQASWGSISQALIFHQVRKYLLLLDPRKEHVKFWRPQMLLLISNPRSSTNLIDFVNDMKKGGLFILGHVKIQSSDEQYLDRCTQEYPSWISLIDHMKIKAFVDMTAATTIREGVLHLIRLSGLGGLRPNTVILGFYDNSIPEDKLRTRPFYKRRWLRSTHIPLRTSTIQQNSPSDLSINTENSLNNSSSADATILHFSSLRQENENKLLDIDSYVQIIRDVLYLKKSICLARNFPFLQRDNLDTNKQKVFIDIWPVDQIVNFIFPETSTQFDVTCLYMLQLATILSMSRQWKNRVILRVFLCIDVTNANTLLTQQNLNNLLNQLRIKAQTRIISYDNLLNLLHYPSQTDSFQSQSTNLFIDINDEYINSINELIRQQCENTTCLYLYLPRPPNQKTLSQRYIQVLDNLSKNLPPTMFVHGVSAVTCTRL